VFSFLKPKASLSEVATFFASFIIGDLPGMEATESEFFLDNLSGRVDEPVFTKERRYLRSFAVLYETVSFFGHDDHGAVVFDAVLQCLSANVHERRLPPDFMETWQERDDAYSSAVGEDFESTVREVTHIFTHYLTGQCGYSLDPRINVPCHILIVSDLSGIAAILKRGRITFP
jgi:hypothetical protein